MSIDTKIFKLGFGLMRLPKNADGSIDVPQVSRMADQFIAAGGTYFDTAYVYDGGASEAALRAAVVERYPREAYTVATKLNASAPGCRDEASARSQFTTSLERIGVDYVDFYLLHAIQRTTYRRYEDYHLWDYVRELKAKGLVKHWGFSSTRIPICWRSCSPGIPTRSSCSCRSITPTGRTPAWPPAATGRSARRTASRWSSWSP